MVIQLKDTQMWTGSSMSLGQCGGSKNINLTRNAGMTNQGDNQHITRSITTMVMRIQRSEKLFALLRFECYSYWIDKRIFSKNIYFGDDLEFSFS